MAQPLVEHGAEVDATDHEGTTPIMFAAMFSRLAILDLLLAHDAAPEQNVANGMTASQLARAMGARQAAVVLKARQPANTGIVPVHPGKEACAGIPPHGGPGRNTLLQTSAEMARR